MNKIPAYLIEDNPRLRARLIDEIEGATPLGFIGSASSADEALNDRRLPKARVVVLDLLLADESTAFEVLRAAVPHMGGTEFFLLTNFATDEIRQKAMQLGVTAVFDKSLEFDRLIERCSDIQLH